MFNILTILQGRATGFFRAFTLASAKQIGARKRGEK